MFLRRLHRRRTRNLNGRSRATFLRQRAPMFSLPLETVRPRRTSCVQLVLSLVAIVTACTGTDGPERAAQPIAVVRTVAQSAQATIEGVVTVAAGTFDDGFAVQDATGGIYVTRAIGTAVKIGDRVRIAGRVVAPNNQAGVEPAAVTRMDASSVPAPINVKTGAVGSVTEGRLIVVRGQLADGVMDDQPWGWKLYVDDGSGPLLIFVATRTNIDVRGLRAGQPLRVTGFSGRYEQHTELLPRGPRDITAPNERR